MFKNLIFCEKLEKTQKMGFIESSISQELSKVLPSNFQNTQPMSLCKYSHNINIAAFMVSELC